MLFESDARRVVRLFDEARTPRKPAHGSKFDEVSGLTLPTELMAPIIKFYIVRATWMFEIYARRVARLFDEARTPRKPAHSSKFDEVSGLTLPTELMAPIIKFADL